MSATARAASSRPSSSPRPVRPPARRRPVLREVPPAPATVAGSGVFALVVVGLLVAGMGVLLVLNTTLAQGAFVISSLTRTQNQLAVQEQQLLQQVAQEEAPESLQARAVQLGMVPVPAPVFLRLADGAILGTPEPAPALPNAQRVGTATSALPPAGTTSATATTATGTTAHGTTTTAQSPTTAATPSTGIDAAVPDPAPSSAAAVRTSGTQRPRTTTRTTTSTRIGATTRTTRNR